MHGLVPAQQAPSTVPQPASVGAWASGREGSRLGASRPGASRPGASRPGASTPGARASKPEASERTMRASGTLIPWAHPHSDATKSMAESVLHQSPCPTSQTRIRPPQNRRDHGSSASRRFCFAERSRAAAVSRLDRAGGVSAPFSRGCIREAPRGRCGRRGHCRRSGDRTTLGSRRRTSALARRDISHPASPHRRSALRRCARSG